MSVAQFFLHSTNQLAKNNISVLFYPKWKLPNNCGGEFAEPSGNRPGVLRLACNRKDWLRIYVHEYSHFLQYINKAPEWAPAEGSYQRFFTWLEKERGSKLLMKDVYVIQKVESLCDRRAVKLIKKWKLPIDIDKYIQGSNAYIYFYMEVVARRSWGAPRKKFPYNVPEVLNKMPCKFLDIKEYRHPPECFKALMDKHCF